MKSFALPSRRVSERLLQLGIGARSMLSMTSTGTGSFAGFSFSRNCA
jgi:hypothetical protein